jgi:ATP-dependent Lon protease
MNSIDNNRLVEEIEQCINEIKGITLKLRNHYKLLFSDGIIASGEYYSIMEKLKEKNKEIIKNEKVINLIKEFDISILYLKLENIKEDFLNIQKDLHIMIKEYGYPTIIDTLNIFLNNNSLNNIDIAKKLGILNEYFTVIDYKEYIENDILIDNTIEIEKNNTENEVTYKNRHVEMKTKTFDDMPVVISNSKELIIYGKRDESSGNSKNKKNIEIEIKNDNYKKEENSMKFSEFTETMSGEIMLKNNYVNLIYELNKAIVKIDIGNNSYVFTGYFKEDTFNELYLNDAFEGKYLKIINFHNKSEKKPNDYEKYKLFVVEYMNQYPVKDFVIKSIDNIIIEIEREYAKNNEISKKTVQDLIDMIMRNDIYNKRQIIIHGLISDNCKKNGDNGRVENNKMYDPDEEIKLNITINYDETKDIIYEKSKFKETKTDANYDVYKKVPKIPKVKMNKATATRYAINSMSRNMDGDAGIEVLVYNSNKTINSNILIDFLKNNILKANEYNIFKKSIHMNLRKKIFTKDVEKTPDKVKEELTWEMKLETLDLSEFEKTKVNEKIKEYRSGKDNSKAETYIDSFFQIPFGKYIKEDIFEKCDDSNNKIKTFLDIINKNENSDIIINSDDTIEQIITKQKQMKKNISEPLGHFIREKDDIKKARQNYLGYTQTVLENAIYGHLDSKRQIKREIAKWLSSGSTDGMVLGFHGPPGVGKTTLARYGISKCLVDNDGCYRPFSMIQLGGQNDGSSFNGHNYTYIGSKCGELIEMLKKSKCMNPILFFDELDKVSDDNKGKDIISILIHLTDKTQNTEMHDKFFSGINFDFSKCIIIFSYNDRSLINKTLRDRITEIQVDALKTHEKIEIIKTFTLPNLSKNINFNCTLDDNLIRYIIEKYTYESGVRKLNEKIEEIFSELNLQYIENYSTKNYVLDEKSIDSILDRHAKILRNMIHDTPRPGFVNGMYATTIGIGGITLIQIEKRTFTEKKDLHLELTGSLGDVMKESIHCSKTVALSLLTEEERTDLKERLEKEPFSLHIHCPDSATPKDGPSAGITITLAIYSFLTGIPVRNDIAMTGEIDIYGKAKQIGGLPAKINGAIKAGVKLVLFPKENEEDFKKIIRKNLLDGDIEHKMVENIKDVLEIALIK